MIFWTTFARKGCFRPKTKRSEQCHWILHISVSLGTKFQLKMTFWISWTISPEKGVFGLNREIEYNHWILPIWIRPGTEFQLEPTVLAFSTKFDQNWYFLSKTEEMNTTIEYWILHLRTILVTKFQLKLTILTFWTKLVQKQ